MRGSAKCYQRIQSQAMPTVTTDTISTNNEHASPLTYHSPTLPHPSPLPYPVERLSLLEKLDTIDPLKDLTADYTHELATLVSTIKVQAPLGPPIGQG